MIDILAAALISAGPHVSVSGGRVDPDYATTVTVTGDGFQSVKGGFGGIYVLFGTVDGRWQPSRGGASGVDYTYVQDAEDKTNHGYIKFVAFPGSSTASSANGGLLDANGHWSTTLVIPGATFPSAGREGRPREVNCRRVTCGVITIGAHGVVSPENETFTPVSFRAPSGGTSAVIPVAGGVAGLGIVAAFGSLAVRRRRATASAPSNALPV